jgi:hypothetical protein
MTTVRAHEDQRAAMGALGTSDGAMWSRFGGIDPGVLHSPLEIPH